MFCFSLVRKSLKAFSYTAERVSILSPSLLLFFFANSQYFTYLSSESKFSAIDLFSFGSQDKKELELCCPKQTMFMNELWLSLIFLRISSWVAGPPPKLISVE